MIDRINLDILRCLRINARCKASDISQKVNLSVSAVIERIRRMEASGIIRQYTVLIDPTQVGNDLTALMEVSLEHPKYYDDLVDMIRQHPNVAECHYLTGEFRLPAQNCNRFLQQSGADSPQYQKYARCVLDQNSLCPQNNQRRGCNAAGAFRLK